MYLSSQVLELQENEVKSQLEKNYGKGTNGFCDNCFKTLDLIIQGVHYFKNDENFTKEGDFKDFNQALRFFSYMHFLRVSYSIKSIYNNISTGYYSDAATQLRTFLETFVRLRFIHKEQDIELVNRAAAGHLKWKGKKFNITYKQQFEDLAPRSYKEYQLLCDFAHGAMTQNVLKWKVSDGQIYTDKGLVFKKRETNFNVNFFSICLHGNLKFMINIFPEILDNANPNYIQKLKESLGFWNTCITESEYTDSKSWYNVMTPLIEP